MNDTTTIKTSNAEINIKVRRYDSTWRDYSKQPRCFVWSDDEFNVLEDLNNRTRRPHTAWRKGLIAAFAEAGLEFDTSKIRWSQHAGCSCPCSPGFVLPHLRINDTWRYDIWVTLHGAPTVDTSKPGRLTGVR